MVVDKIHGCMHSLYCILMSLSFNFSDLRILIMHRLHYIQINGLLYMSFSMPVIRNGRSME